MTLSLRSPTVKGREEGKGKDPPENAVPRRRAPKRQKRRKIRILNRAGRNRTDKLSPPACAREELNLAADQAALLFQFQLPPDSELCIFPIIEAGGCLDSLRVPDPPPDTISISADHSRDAEKEKPASALAHLCGTRARRKEILA